MARKTKAYRLSPLAINDLEGIYVYTLQTWSVNQAVAYHSRLVDAFEGLAAGEQVGRPADIHDGYFKSLCGAHVIYYRQVEDAIEVMRILHQSMDVGRHLNP